MSAPGRPDASVFVEAPARLHFGVLDLHGGLGRRFGGMGAAIPTPSLLLEAARAGEVEGDGPDADRAAAFARRFLARHGQRGGVHLRLHRAIPAHVGLGSGTQLGLAVARAVAGSTSFQRFDPRAGPDGRPGAAVGDRHLGVRVGRVHSRGRAPAGTQDERGPAARTLRNPTRLGATSWSVPPAAPGLSGEAEADAFRRLPPPNLRDVERLRTWC